MPDEVKMRMSRQQASALYCLVLVYLFETRKPGSDLPQQWIDILTGTAVSVEELLEMVTTNNLTVFDKPN